MKANSLLGALALAAIAASSCTASTQQTSTERQYNNAMISSQELTSIPWQFGRANGVVLGKMQLRPDGKIAGYSHANESRWALEGSELVFYSSNGRPSTRFNSFGKRNGRWIISGPFLLGGNITHVLEELPP